MKGRVCCRRGSARYCGDAGGFVLAASAGNSARRNRLPTMTTLGPIHRITIDEEIVQLLRDIVEEKEMPNYTYKCKDCGRVQDYVRSIAERDKLDVSCLCGGEYERQVDAPAGKVQGGTPKFFK